MLRKIHEKAISSFKKSKIKFELFACALNYIRHIFFSTPINSFTVSKLRERSYSLEQMFYWKLIDLVSFSAIAFLALLAKRIRSGMLPADFL